MQILSRSKDRNWTMKKARARSTPVDELPSPEDFGLDGRAAEYWHRIAPQMVKVGLLTPLHIDTFAEICRTYAEYRRLDEWLKEDPSRLTFTSDKGYESETPQVRMRNQALATLQKLWPKFGLTPFALAQMRKHGGVVLPTKSSIQKFAERKNGKAETKPEAKQRSHRRVTKKSATRRMGKVDPAGGG